MPLLIPPRLLVGSEFDLTKGDGVLAPLEPRVGMELLLLLLLVILQGLPVLPVLGAPVMEKELERVAAEVVSSSGTF